MVAAPFVLGAAGFAAAGTTAGSWAAGMMSAPAVANGGAVEAGTTPAVLQSVGKSIMSRDSKQTLKHHPSPMGSVKMEFTQTTFQRIFISFLTSSVSKKQPMRLKNERESSVVKQCVL